MVKKKIKPKQRTLREITNLIKRLREMGAVSIEVGDIKSTFLPQEPSQANEITEVINNHITESSSKIEQALPLDKTKKELEEDENDVFDDGLSK